MILCVGVTKEKNHFLKRVTLFGRKISKAYHYKGGQIVTTSSLYSSDHVKINLFIQLGTHLKTISHEPKTATKVKIVFVFNYNFCQTILRRGLQEF